MPPRAFARKLKLKLVRALQGASLRISSPYDFLGQALLLMEDRAFMQYLAENDGAGQLLSGLYDLAEKEPALQDYLIKTEIGNAFNRLYMPLAKDGALQPHLAERGADDLYRYAYVLAQEAGLPLAQRSESFSQEGEDLIIGRMFDGVRNGFFVDVGAHHPFRFSNTWLLYRRGWRGINIDAMPGAMAAFHRWRPQDVNIECLVSTTTETRRFFQYEEPALNTLSEEIVRQRERDFPQYRIKGTTLLAARRLDDILSEYLPPGQAIDLLNVDVEGHDLEVLASNDWDRYKPRIIVAELLGAGFSEMEQTELYQFLVARGYKLHSKLVNSAIFSRDL
jgi:FkbM family methyltransferase